MQLKNLAVIVTGGASGLGAATARLLAVAGARVCILDLQTDKANKLALEISGIAIECDVANEQSAEGAVTKARSIHGPARVLVNCAGIGTPGRIVGKEGPMPLQDFEKEVRINLIGSFT